MEVILIEDKAFHELLDKVLARVMAANAIKEDKWVTEEVAMNKLKISSKSTLQKWRNEGRIRYTQPEKKIILYDVDSIYAFLEKHAKNTF